MEGSMQDRHDGDPPSFRRARAPTITIDTTEANTAEQTRDPLSPVSPTDPGYSPITAVDSMAANGSSQPAARSLDNRDSRPTSPHNVSSPVASRGNDRGAAFLAVPQNNMRSRQNSVDSDDGSRGSVSSHDDTTVVGSSSYHGGKTDRSVTVGSNTDNDKIMNDPDALKPDQNAQDDFHVDNNPFAYSPGQLNKMFNPKSLSAFYKLGGLAGFEKGLRTDRKAGLSIDESVLDGNVSFESATASAKKAEHKGHENGSSEVAGAPKAQPAPRHQGDGAYASRKRVFKDNRLPEKKGKSLLQLMWITYNDKVLILLSIAAVVSLAIGLYQTFGTEHDADHPAVEWVEGVAIIVAIAIVVIVGSLNDFQKERQFAKLNRKKQDRIVKVVRSGKTIELSIFDILVGDVLHIEPGDMVPVDGILIEGFNVKCDESQATGESDIIRKRPADEVYAAIENHDDLKKMDPFIQSGARVMEGVGTFLVTSTGVYSSYGKTLMSLNEDPEITPLQSKLNVIAEYIAKLGGAAGLLLFVVLLIKFLAGLPHNTKSGPEKGQQFLDIFIQVVTIIVVAVPEGLPLAVTLALAFATNRMLKDNNLVRHLKACEVMGNATTICSDKTGTLTQNKMQVVAATVGTTQRFGDVHPLGETTESTDRDVTAKELVSKLNSQVKELLLKSISLNSTAFEGEVDGQKTFIGSKTETALLVFAQEFLGMAPVSEERANAKILQLIPFDSGRKCMGVAVRHDQGARLYVKGASEIMLEKCSMILADPAKDISGTALADDHRESIKTLIETYATNSLRTIGIIYKDFEQWPPKNARRTEGEKDEIVFEDLCKDMTFVAMVGIKDPLRPGVPEAVRECQRAGVVVRMVTGDNKLTAQAIAKDCGILHEDSIVMEGPNFRNLSKAEQEEIIPRLHVLARSSPEDKRILVRRLKDLGETVAVTGDGTNDAPALKLADVGFSMGIAGTEVAKEASAIILMDDNFNSIVKALKWGRAVNDAVKRFLQFQLTVNVTAVVLTFITAAANGDEKSVLTAVQLLWVNLIMDTLAALALATDPPQDSVLDRKPERKGSSIISTTMWKMIIGQAIYQLLITLLLYFGAEHYLPISEAAKIQAAKNPSIIQTLVFNTFVWMQIFNQWNSRRLDNKLNIFEGLLKNWFFIAINAIMCGGQVLIVMVGGHAFAISPFKQSPEMWAIAIVLGVLSIPAGILIRLIPDAWVEALVPAYFKRRRDAKKVPGLTVSDDDERFNAYPEPLADVHDELAFIRRIKGGRLNNLKFAMKHPVEYITKVASPAHSREHSRTNSLQRLPQTPTREDSFGSHSGAHTPDSRKRSRSMRSRSNSAFGAATVMTGIVAGSIAAGWSPIERRGDGDFGHFPAGGASDAPTKEQSPTVGVEQAGGELQEIGRPSGSDQNVPILGLPSPKPRPSTDKKSAP